MSLACHQPSGGFAVHLTPKLSPRCGFSGIHRSTVPPSPTLTPPTRFTPLWPTGHPLSQDRSNTLLPLGASCAFYLGAFAL